MRSQIRLAITSSHQHLWPPPGQGSIKRTRNGPVRLCRQELLWKQPLPTLNANECRRYQLGHPSRRNGPFHDPIFGNRLFEILECRHAPLNSFRSLAISLRTVDHCGNCRSLWELSITVGICSAVSCRPRSSNTMKYPLTYPGNYNSRLWFDMQTYCRINSHAGHGPSTTH